MKVCLFRHGPAAPGRDDDARRLTAAGRLRTRRAARGIERLDLGIDEIWTSPLPRAGETAAILADVLGLAAPRPSVLLRPGVPARRLLDVLRGAKGRCPVLVGHEPGLGEAVARLTGGRPGAFPLKKAGLAVVDIESSSLLLLLTPAVLRRLGR